MPTAGSSTRYIQSYAKETTTIIQKFELQNIKKRKERKTLIQLEYELKHRKYVEITTLNVNMQCADCKT